MQRERSPTLCGPNVEKEKVAQGSRSVLEAIMRGATTSNITSSSSQSRRFTDGDSGWRSNSDPGPIHPSESPLNRVNPYVTLTVNFHAHPYLKAQKALLLFHGAGPGGFFAVCHLGWHVKFKANYDRMSRLLY